jgi:DNA polymerase-4
MSSREAIPLSRTDPTHRWIAHLDLDAFFASCEQRDHPAYRHRPVVVGALPGHRGVVAAASYEARSFGIHSAMPISQAYRRCPHAVFLRPDMDKYRRASRQVLAVLEEITPLVEAASIDEAYLDLSGLEKLFGPPAQIGRELKRRIFEATGLTASVGIGPNRLIAKLGSENGKPDGLTVVAPDQVLDFLATMPVSNLRGVGARSQRVFAGLGIHRVAQLRTCPPATLQLQLGKRAAANLQRQAYGQASDRVEPDRRRKSISKETTFDTDVSEHPMLRDTLRRLAAEVAAGARREGLHARVVTVKIRFAGFETHTRQRRRPATNDERVILDTAWRLLLGTGLPDKPVRLIGVGLSDWQDQAGMQCDLFENTRETSTDQRLLRTIDRVRERFGEGMLQVGAPRGRRPAD